MQVGHSLTGFNREYTHKGCYARTHMQVHHCIKSVYCIPMLTLKIIITYTGTSVHSFIIGPIMLHHAQKITA